MMVIGYQLVYVPTNLEFGRENSNETTLKVQILILGRNFESQLKLNFGANFHHLPLQF